jgi:aryl-alcohol dehydrogenase-like predicted oxidoreductase
MSHLYGPVDEDRCGRTIERAADLGVTLIDTADSYGFGHNEELVGRAIAGRRDDVVIATKFGLAGVREDARPGDIGGLIFDASPKYVHQAIDASLLRLGIEHVDLYYLHVYDGSTPIEETVAAMAELVGLGKVGHIGLSGVDADILRRANEIHPIAAVQVDYSLLNREVERDVVPVASELGVGVVPYSPIGRGLLTGGVRSAADLGQDDFRKVDPRFEGEVLEANVRRADKVLAIASQSGISPATLALAWLLAQGDHIVPIPGTTRPENVEKNADSAKVQLSAAQLRALDQATLSRGEVDALDAA